MSFASTCSRINFVHWMFENDLARIVCVNQSHDPMVFIYPWATYKKNRIEVIHNPTKHLRRSFLRIWVTAVSCWLFAKQLHFRCLTWFWTRLCWILHSIIKVTQANQFHDNFKKLDFAFCNPNNICTLPW